MIAPSLLNHPRPTLSPPPYFIAPIAILMVAILATYMLARRAAGINPMNALRQE
jgi:ABC-type lipoprotein release transport system permease subunit